ncbi:MAG: hypothetical protein Q9197_005212 [Variospora fuerteventurae]
MSVYAPVAEYLREYVEATRSDTKLLPAYPRIEEFYTIESDSLRDGVGESITTSLALCSGISASNLFFIDVSYRDGSTPYINWADTVNGVIICNENFADKDPNPPEKRLWPSEILWQIWERTAVRQQSTTSTLRAIARSTIINESTQNIIWQSTQSSTSSREGEKGYVEYTSKDEAYYAILGSPNGGSTMRMLLDHKSEHGFRTVDKIVIISKDRMTPANPESRTLIILLSGIRTPS